MNGDPYADTFPTERGASADELTDDQIAKLDSNDSLIIDAIQLFLGVPCDYEDDDMCDIVHTIGDMISEWGELKKGVPEIESYPYIIRDEVSRQELDSQKEFKES